MSYALISALLLVNLRPLGRGGRWAWRKLRRPGATAQARAVPQPVPAPSAPVPPSTQLRPDPMSICIVCCRSVPQDPRRQYFTDRQGAPIGALCIEHTAWEFNATLRSPLA